jgi:hypothetical protein
MNFEKRIKQLEMNVINLENMIEHLQRKYVIPYEKDMDVFETTSTKIEYVDGKEYISTIQNIHFLDSFFHKDNNVQINKFVVELEESFGKYEMYRQSNLPQPQIGTILKHLIKDTTLLSVKILQI